MTDGLTSTDANTFLPAASEAMSYDADGNLTSDGVWDYTYDGENRLIQMTPVTAVVNLTGSPTDYPAQQLTFAYDYLGRRVDKQVYAYSGGWMLSSETKFVYAGWNLLAETNASGTLQRTYAWGLDVAGSLTATGGIGALAEIVDHVGGTAYLPAYDGSGNVAALIKASDGSVAASYEYGPYGQLLRQEGAFAASNPFRFSTHYWDQETGDVYYGYRYYSPGLGRFLNRDPQGEAGGLNLYGFVGNDPINGQDVLGQDKFMIWTGIKPDGTPIMVEGDDPNPPPTSVNLDYLSTGLQAMDDIMQQVSNNMQWTMWNPFASAADKSSAAAWLGVSPAGSTADSTTSSTANGLPSAAAVASGWNQTMTNAQQAVSSSYQQGEEQLISGLSSNGLPMVVSTGFPTVVPGGVIFVSQSPIINSSASMSNGETVLVSGLNMHITYYHLSDQIYNWSQTVMTDTLPNSIGTTPYSDGLRGAEPGTYYPPGQLLNNANPPGAAVFYDHPFDTGPGTFSAFTSPVDVSTASQGSPFTVSWGFTYSVPKGYPVITPTPIMMFPHQ